MLIELFLIFSLALALRVAPIILVPHGSGVDQWYWKTYVETLRRDGTLPVKMPQFLLDEGHWYPPFFPWVLAKIPAAIFDRFSMQLAVFIDMLRMSILVWATWWLTRSEAAAVIAGTAYAITPLLITYNLQLNPRGMGALFLDIMWLLAGAFFLRDAPVWIWIPIFIFAGLVLITHKMSMQLFWFTALVGSGLAIDLRLALLIPGSIIFAIILSGGFYRLAMRAHWDILKFWSRNWSGNGVHPILESPVYGNAGYESPGKFYRSGWKAWVRRLQFVVGFNPWMSAVLFFAAVAWYSDHQFSDLEVWVFSWAMLTFLFALLTTIIPVLRTLGQGYLYGYNGIFPAALILGLTWEDLGAFWYWRIAVFLACAACLSALFVFLRALRTSRTMKIDANLDAAIHRLEHLQDGTVMCLPQHWHDVVAYRTKKSVLFGGHGYGFKLLEPIFPVLRLPVKKIIDTYKVCYLLTFEGYLPSNFLEDLPNADVENFGEYRLYKFEVK